MADLRDVMPFIIEECPGVPEPSALRAIRSAAIELAREARIIVEYPDAIVIATNEPDYELDLDDGYTLVAIKEAWVNGARIDVLTPEKLAQLGGDWQSRSGPVPTGVLLKTPEVVTVYPAPSASGATLKMRIVTAPSYDSITLRDDLFAIYVETIAAGARSRLQAQPGKPWSNPQYATLNQNRFIAGKNAARVRANRDGGNELRVTIPRA